MTTEALFRCIVPVTESGCWLWDGLVDPKGYGRAYVNGKTHAVHRFVYEHYRGPIPPGLQIDHLCRVRCCVNPDHLEPVTSEVNTKRGIGPTALNTVKTHCPHGHPYTPENVYSPPQNGGRQCRICKRNGHLRWNVKRRAREAQRP